MNSQIRKLKRLLARKRKLDEEVIIAYKLAENCKDTLLNQELKELICIKFEINVSIPWANL